MDKNIRYALVSLAYNELESLKLLVPQIYKIQDIGIENNEILVIDDGSNDGSNIFLEECKKRYKNFNYITYDQNRGKSFALRQALKFVNTEFLITIDSDLQDDLNDLRRIIELLRNYDLVVTNRIKRGGSIFFKIAPSFLANCIYKKVLDINISDFNCSMKGFKIKSNLKNIYFEKGAHRFLAYYLIKKLGYNYIEIQTVQRKRMLGEPKYNSFSKRFLSFFYWLYQIKCKKYNFDKPLNNRFFSQLIN